MLTLTLVKFATVEELFEYKASDFELPPFPSSGDPDQWGIKAHNRPWVARIGDWQRGQRVIEVGGAYSGLPEWLGTEYGVEPWVGDDFGLGGEDEEMWTRWGDPHEHAAKHPAVTYVFENFGTFSPSYPDKHFHRVFTISTLEHVPVAQRLDVLKDMNRCTARGGRQIHTIDIPIPSFKKLAFAASAERLVASRLAKLYSGGVAAWLELFKRSGVTIAAKPPSSLALLDRATLVESPDVFFRYVPPNNEPKPYAPMASLLVVIEDLL